MKLNYFLYKYYYYYTNYFSSNGGNFFQITTKKIKNSLITNKNLYEIIKIFFKCENYKF